MTESEKGSVPVEEIPFAVEDLDYDPEALAKEEAHLRELNKKPPFARIGGYFSLSGPGWLQAALTLGGGSAGASLAAGYLFGYKLLWVQPLAMLCGVIMTSAVAYMMCSTKDRPMEAVSKYAHPSLAWAWALSSLLSSIIWCLPQFNLAASVMSDWSRMVSPDKPIPTSSPIWLIPCLAIVVFTTILTWNYGRSNFWVRFCESVLKLLVAAIILCFAFVLLRTKTNWGGVLKGFTGFYIPKANEDYSVPIAAFATAVGINMTFLFPCSLRARGWGKPHRGLARFDIWTGMLIPYILATSFVIIATANVFPGPNTGGLKAEMFAKALEPVAGPFFAHVIFGCGVLGMTISTIAMLQLVNGFVLTEIFKVDRRSIWFKIGSLTPAIGFLGPVIWGSLNFYLVMPTSVICFFTLPVAYISFLILINSKRFLGSERPEGAGRLAWNISMIIVVLVVLAACVFSGVRSVMKFADQLEKRQETAAVMDTVQVDESAPARKSLEELAAPTPRSPEVPIPTPFTDDSGREVLFNDDFSSGIARHWNPTDPTAWSIGVDGTDHVYALTKVSDYRPPFRSPLSYTLIRDVTPTDFEMVVTAKSTGKEGDNHRDLCLIFGYQDPAHFYYAHLGAVTDENAHGIFIVDGAPRRNVTLSKTEGAPWDDAYHVIRLVRVGDSISVFWDQEETPVLTAADSTFAAGLVGLGSFDNTGFFRNVSLYAV